MTSIILMTPPTCFTDAPKDESENGPPCWINALDVDVYYSRVKTSKDLCATEEPPFTYGRSDDDGE
jgi:hypothetical protein